MDIQISSNFERYSSRLSQSLAWRSTTGIAEVVGMGAYIDQTKLTLPEDPSEMGMVMRNGRRERINRPRATGDALVFETTQQRASKAVETLTYGEPQVEKIH